jgi:hypothetical protein
MNFRGKLWHIAGRSVFGYERATHACKAFRACALWRAGKGGAAHTR